MTSSVYRTAVNRLRATRILSVRDESQTVKTFTFKDKMCAKAKPGQFLMLWIPGVDEIPLSVLNVEGDGTVSVAVKKVGEATKALHDMKIGETIGVRGPFGNNFTLTSRKALIVGGGTGVAPLLFLVKKLKSMAVKVVFVIGAKTKDELLFVDELRRLCGNGNVIATTEDGSYGLKCQATDPLRQLLMAEEFDIVYTCGPERMMKGVLDVAEERGLILEASLERLMRCAIGLCGSCVIGRYRVCRDGPVFTSKQLKEVRDEFGALKRDFNGRRVPLE